MNDVTPVIVQVGHIGQFALSIKEAQALRDELERKIGARFAAVVQYVVEPKTAAPAAKEPEQMELDLSYGGTE